MAAPISKVGLAAVAAGGAVAYTLASASFYTISSGSKAVVLANDEGAKPTIVDEGMHFKSPFSSGLVITEYSLRPALHSLNVATKSVDDQDVKVQVEVLCQLDDEKLLGIYNMRLTPEGIAGNVIPRGITAATSEIVSESTAAQLEDAGNKTFRGPAFVKKKVCEHASQLLENFGVKVVDCKVQSIKCITSGGSNKPKPL